MPVAIVTGASRGLGLALAQALAARDWKVVVDARDQAELSAATAGADIVALAGDVNDSEHRRSLLDEAGPSVDLLVNNASRLGPSPQPPLAAYPLEELQRVIATNVLAPLALAQLVLPRMAPGAAIVNVTSDAAVEPYPGWGGYGSSKAALEQQTAILAAEHPAVRIYAVDPGDMRTRMQQEAFPDEDISDRALPRERVPAILTLIEGTLPSGRYVATELEPVRA